MMAGATTNRPSPKAPQTEQPQVDKLFYPGDDDGDKCGQANVGKKRALDGKYVEVDLSREARDRAWLQRGRPQVASTCRQSIEAHPRGADWLTSLPPARISGAIGRSGLTPRSPLTWGPMG